MILQTPNPKNVLNSKGRENARYNINVLAKVKYKPVDTLPVGTGSSSSGDVAAGTLLTGIMYSSVAVDYKFVGVDVSLYTFLSALRDANSVLYKKLSHSFMSRTYYGMACSSMSSTMIGLPMTTSSATYFAAHRDLFTEISRNEAQIGDVWAKSNHVKLVANVYTRDGVEYVDIVESAPTYPQWTHYTMEQFRVVLPEYQVFRYHYIDDVERNVETFNFTNADNYGFSFPDAQCNFGDKASVLPTDEISVNVLDDTGYSSMELYKDGALQHTYATVETVSLGTMSAGKYEMRLIGEGKTSSTWWIVADMHSSFDAATNVVSFSSSNAECVSMTGEIQATYGSDGWMLNYWPARAFEIVGDDERTSGEKDITSIINFTPATGGEIVRALAQFKTEFGTNFIEVWHRT